MENSHILKRIPPPSSQTQPQPSTQSPPGNQVPFSQKIEEEKDDFSQQLVLLLKLEVRELSCKIEGRSEGRN